MLSSNNNQYLKIEPKLPLIKVDNFEAFQIPLIYQTNNKTFEISNNHLINSRNGFEIHLNGNYAHDSLFQTQTEDFDYFNGIKINRSNNHKINRSFLNFSIDGFKPIKNKSIYFEIGGKFLSFIDSLQVAQQIGNNNQSLLSRNNNIYLNFNENFKKNKFLFMFSSGFNYQFINQVYRINNDYLFWISIPDSSLHYLKMKMQNNFFTYYFSGRLNFKLNNFFHEINLGFRSDKISLKSSLFMDSLLYEKSLPEFYNDNSINTNEFNLKYTSLFSVIKNISSGFNINHALFFINKNNKLYTFFLNDYNFSIKYKQKKIGEYALFFGYKSEMPPNDMYYDNSIITGNRFIQSGYLNPFLNHRIQSKFNHTLFTGNNGLFFSFLSVDYSLIKSEYLREIFVDTLFTSYKYQISPNTSGSLTCIYSIQKNFNKIPIKLYSNFMYNQKREYYISNNRMYLSNLSTFSSSLGGKTIFKSFFNFELYTSFSLNQNSVLNSYFNANKTYFFNNKGILYFTFSKSFFSSLSFQKIQLKHTLNNDYDFVDLSLTKIIKQKLSFQIDIRNLLNIESFDSNSISFDYVKTNKILLNGRQVFLGIKYQFK